MSKLSDVMEDYMNEMTDLDKFCDRCLRTERYGSNVNLMVVDAAFDSIGLDYFNNIVPKVLDFREDFVIKKEVRNLKDLSKISYNKIEYLWANERSWNVATSIASFLHKLEKNRRLDSRGALRTWANNADLKSWRKNPIGQINGVGPSVFQYLRMMGGVDTAMPDKIVRRVIEEILEKAEAHMPTENDIEFVRTVDRISSLTGYRTIELCWMTWLIQKEDNKTRLEKYEDILHEI